MESSICDVLENNPEYISSNIEQFLSDCRMLQNGVFKNGLV